MQKNFDKRNVDKMLVKKLIFVYIVRLFCLVALLWKLKFGDLTPICQICQFPLIKVSGFTVPYLSDLYTCQIASQSDIKINYILVVQWWPGSHILSKHWGQHLNDADRHQTARIVVLICTYKQAGDECFYLWDAFKFNISNLWALETWEGL